MGITLANNAHTTLSANISSVDTTVYVDDIDSFPALGVGDYFYCTIESTTGTYEIVKVTQINATNFIVVRAQEGTIAVPFNIGARVELRMTVQSLEDFFVSGSNVNDDAYSSAWNGDATDAPSRNVIYDKLETMVADSDIGVTVQAYDADLTTWAGLTPSAFFQTLVDDTSAAAARTTLGVVIGTDVQAYDADLTTWAGLTPSANAQSLVTAANYAAMRTLLDLEAGTDFNAYDAGLEYLSGLNFTNEATFKAGVNLEIGTDVQAQNAILTLLSTELFTSDAAGSLYLGKQTAAGPHYLGVKIDSTAPGIGGFKWNLEGVDQWRLSMNYAGSLFLYNDVLPGTVYTVSPATNIMTFSVTPKVPDEAYGVGWNASVEVPTKNAVYDKIESLVSLSDGDKGDITVSASGATWTIDSGAVSLAKMATMATSSFLGRVTAATGNVEVLSAANAKTILALAQADISGLTTASSPQFTGIELGHATDTTLTRSSAGNLAIEGNVVYRAAGTDVAIADGGTGASLTDPNADRIMFWDDSAGAVTWLAPNGFNVNIDTTTLYVNETWTIACSDETTALTTGTAKATFVFPYNVTVVSVGASVNTAGTALTIDINDAGVSILSTKLTLDSAEKTSLTAATAAVISDTSIAAGAEVSVDFDTVTGTWKGCKVWMIVHRTS